MIMTVKRPALPTKGFKQTTPTRQTIVNAVGRDAQASLLPFICISALSCEIDEGLYAGVVTRDSPRY
jgi:hypothetical protein